MGWQWWAFWSGELRDKDWVTDPASERAVRSRKERQSPVLVRPGVSRGGEGSRLIKREKARSPKPWQVKPGFEEMTELLLPTTGRDPPEGSLASSEARPDLGLPWAWETWTGAGAWQSFCSRRHSKPTGSRLGGFKVQNTKQTVWFLGTISLQDHEWSWCHFE